MNEKELLAAGLGELRERDGDMGELFGSRGEDLLFLLDSYIQEIERFNPAYGLVGAKDRRELVIKHILDSLAPLGIICRLLKKTSKPPETGRAGSPVATKELSRRIADAGSGAGLPGIPLAISLPACRFTLIERMGRRAGFLRNTLAVLGITNADVEEGEIERAEPGIFNLITLRAFRPSEPAVLRELFRLLAPGGFLAAYKGRRDKISQELGAVNSQQASWEIFPCPVPFLDEERHLVIIRPS